MIVLDTNVLSELVRTVPSRTVLSWFERQIFEELWITAITEAEMLVGIVLLPNGKRKNELANAAERLLGLFSNRILPFDRAAASRLPDVMLERRRAGLQTRNNSFIAAIARAHSAAVATRDIRDFTHCGIRVIDPWNSGTQ